MSNMNIIYWNVVYLIPRKLYTSIKASLGGYPFSDESMNQNAKKRKKKPLSFLG